MGEEEDADFDLLVLTYLFSGGAEGDGETLNEQVVGVDLSPTESIWNDGSKV